MTATDLKCPIDLLEHWTRTCPQSIYLRQPEHGKIREMTWATVWYQTRRMAAALLSMGQARVPTKAAPKDYNRHCLSL